MKNGLCIIAMLFTVNCFAQFTIADFASLHGIIGSWKVQKKKGFIIEEWTMKNDSTLIGYSFLKTMADSIIPQENVALIYRNGSISYTPVTAGQNEEKPVTFTLTSIRDGKYFFENKFHDFPTMITYQLVDQNTLNAAISGLMQNEQIEIPYNYTRQQ